MKCYQMRKTINTSKLKVKYVLGNYLDLDTYPTTEDISFEFIRDYCLSSAKEIKFTDVSLQKRYELDDEQLNKVIKELLSFEFIKEINSTALYTTYKFIKNPFN